MARDGTMILTSLEFPSLVKLFHDKNIPIPIADARVEEFLEHDILRLTMRLCSDERSFEESPIEILLEILYAKHAWMYGVMCYEERPGVKKVQKLEEIIVPERLVIRSPFDYFKEGAYKHFPTVIDEIDVILPEFIPLL